MNADYQLRHATLARRGSFWSRQTSTATREMARDLVRTASLPSRIQHLDAGGAYALDSRTVLKEDLVIDFTDGHFAMAGPDMMAYVAVDDNDGVYEMLRDNTYQGSTGSTPFAHQMSPWTAAQLVTMTSDLPELTTMGVWYLIPKPEYMNPIVLETKISGVRLSYGVDFFTSKYFIITQHSPAAHFTAGSILVSLAEILLESFDAYPSDTPRTKKGRKWTTTYAHRSQSMELFRRAAAEFCGLFVLQHDDILLNATTLEDSTVVYAFASAGVVTVDYPHTQLVVGSSYRAGHVVCDQFELKSKLTHGATFLIDDGLPVDLSGMLGLPVQMPASGFVVASYAYVNSDVKTHLQLYLGGALEHVSMTWAAQMAHEIRYNTLLSDQLGLDDPETFPVEPTVNYASLMTNFYGRRLFLLVMDGVPERMRFELTRFLREHVPTGVVVVTATVGAPVLNPPPYVEPPETYVFYAGTPLHYETSVLAYD